jgi:succinoglycan biosynthesis protein ExoL
MNLVYFVYDLNDSAMRRRILMLRAGGVNVQLVGFYRGAVPAAVIEGAPTLVLGETFDAQMIHRALSVLRTIIRAGAVIQACRGADLFMARNLEMLSIAVRVRAALRGNIRLIYECLDIHRLMLSGRAHGRALRGLERWLMRDVAMLLVSSPAFVTHYFQARQHVRAPVCLAENKVLDLSAAPQPRPERDRPAGPPWRIGWFGMIRCRRSLEILIALTNAMAGEVEVIIRGRPAYSEFDDFEATVSSAPWIRFEGPYVPADLADHYAEVHFVWAIDYFEVGLNSSWLLPNRLYEGSWFGSVPLAEKHVETGVWLARHKAGVLMDSPAEETPEFFRALTAEKYSQLRNEIRSIPDGDLRIERAECDALTGRIAGTVS